MSFTTIEQSEVNTGQPLKQSLFQKIKDNLDYLHSISNANTVLNVGTSTENAVPRFDGVTGKLIQSSSVIIDDAGKVSISPTTSNNAIDIVVSGTGKGIYVTSVSGSAFHGYSSSEYAGFFDGKIKTTGQIECSDGSVSAPSISFSNSLSTGMYYSSSRVNFSVGGVNSFNIEQYQTFTQLQYFRIFQSACANRPTLYSSSSDSSAFRNLCLGLSSLNSSTSFGCVGFANGNSSGASARVQTFFDYNDSNCQDISRYAHNIRTSHNATDDDDNFISFYVWKVGDPTGGYGTYESLRIGTTGVYVTGSLSADSIIDRTPYPKNKQTAIDAINSLKPLSDNVYSESNKKQQLNHEKLHPYLKGSKNGTRDVGATLSCAVRVIQDLLERVAVLETRVGVILIKKEEK